MHLIKSFSRSCELIRQIRCPDFSASHLCHIFGCYGETCYVHGQTDRIQFILSLKSPFDISGCIFMIDMHIQNLKFPSKHSNIF